MLKENEKIPLDQFINKSLFDDDRGYYMTKNPFGKNGDFITSPNISIMFSEMISIWLISFWKKLGSPKKINIVELGGGNGEMIYQIIKTINNFQNFKKAAKFIIIDKSPILTSIQKKRLKNFNVVWKRKLEKISTAPNIFIANEFFDAFPVKHFIKRNNNWYEKYITKINNTYTLYEKKINKKYVEEKYPDLKKNKLNFLEFSPSCLKVLNDIAKLIRKYNGGLLVIDYGYNKKKMFNSIQSIKNHRKADYLKDIYNCDITHLINFHNFKIKLKKDGLNNIKFTTQRNFLIKLGIKDRANIISKNLSLTKKLDLQYRLNRLLDNHQMGSLFKVLFATNKKNKFNLGF